MENEIQDVDPTNYNEEVTNDDSHQEIDVEKLKETNSKLYARAKQAEQELKNLRSQAKPVAESVPTNNTYVSREELDLAILQTKNGYDEETVENLKVISKGKGVSLLQAQEDPLFKLMLAQKEQERKQTQAKLGTSRGSSSTKAVKIESMSREEHMAYVKSLNN
jgi:hypothetical protein